MNPRFAFNWLAYGLILTLGLLAEADAQADPPADPPAPAVVDIFAVRTWAPARPVAQPAVRSVKKPPVMPERAPEPVPEPVPEAPALPFRFLGRFVDPDKGPAFLLGKNGEVLFARVGDVLGIDYQLEQYADGILTFVYRPLAVRQTLAVGVLP